MEDRFYSDTQVKAYLSWCNLTGKAATIEGFRDFVEDTGETFYTSITTKEIPSYVKC